MATANPEDNQDDNCEDIQLNNETELSQDIVIANIKHLRKQRERLKNQLTERKAALLSCKKKGDGSGDEDPEKIQESIAILQKDLQKESTNKALRQLMLKQVSMGTAMHKILFPKRTVTDVPEEHKQILSLLQRQTELVSKVMSHHKVIQQRQTEINTLQKASLDCKKRNRELMYNLQKLRDEEESHLSICRQNQSIAKSREELDEVICRVEVVRKVFQRLIIGSRIDWAQEENMSDLMVNLGSSLKQVLDNT